MPAALNQDFVTYQGDDVSPIFTVRDASAAAVNISTVLEITWSARRDLDDTVALSKTKTLGDITFVTDGTDGKFQVAIVAADTILLSGFYAHYASVKDVLGNITTVTVGRMQVGLPPAWTYDAGQVGNKDVYAVRRLVGDVIANDQQLTDPEIQFALTLRTSIYGAAAELCRMLSAQYARKVDTITGPELRTNFSQQHKQYLAMADRYDGMAALRGAGAMPYAGGISIADKIDVEAQTDRVPPQFTIAMDDNLRVPVGPIGRQTQSFPPASGNA